MSLPRKRKYAPFKSFKESVKYYEWKKSLHRAKGAGKVMRDAEEFAKKFDCSPEAYFKFVRKAQLDGEEP